MMFGTVMLLCVRGVGKLLPEETWVNLGIQTAAGIAVYGGLTLAYWKAAKKGLWYGKQGAGNDGR